MRHSFQSTTAHELRTIDESLDDPIKFHLCRWIDDVESKQSKQSDDENKEQRPQRLIVSRLLEYWDGNTRPNAVMLSDEGCVRVIFNLMAETSPFFISFRKQVEFFLKQMSDENPQLLRKLSLKIIEKVRWSTPFIMRIQSECMF
jgi:hypothetical protein